MTHLIGFGACCIIVNWIRICKTDETLNTHIFKYITYGHFYKINKYNVDVIADAYDNVISGNERS